MEARERANTSTVQAMLAAERPQLVRLCVQLTGDVEAAEDLAQETLVKAWQHAHTLCDPGARAVWLCTIARRECLRWVRRQGRELARRAQPPDPGRELMAWNLEDRVADDVDVEVELERVELAQLLDRAMALLSPLTRAVLVEKYIQESPQAESAARLGMSKGTIEPFPQHSATHPTPFSTSYALPATPLTWATWPHASCACHRDGGSVASTRACGGCLSVRWKPREGLQSSRPSRVSRDRPGSRLSRRGTSSRSSASTVRLLMDPWPSP